MKTQGKILLLLLLGMALLTCRAWAQALSGRYFIKEGQANHFSGSLEETFNPLRVSGGGDGSIGRILSLQIDKGRITNEDWKTLRKNLGLPYAEALTESFRKLESIVADSEEVSSDDMLDLDREVAMSSSLKTFIVPSLRRLSCSVFLRTRVHQFNLDGVEEVGHGAFRMATRLKTLDLPKAKIIKAYAFTDCSQLRTLKTPKLTGLVNGQEGSKPGGNTFNGCIVFSEWHLGTAFNPSGVDPSHFAGLPPNRNIVLVDALGKELTGAALTNAVSKFKSTSGWDAATSTWHGWTVGAELHPIQITVVGEHPNTIFTTPVSKAKAGTMVRVLPEWSGWGNASSMIEGIKIVLPGGSTLVIDPRQVDKYEFEMPNGPVAITVTMIPVQFTVRVFMTLNGQEYVDDYETISFWDLNNKHLKQRHPLATTDDIWRIEFIKGDFNDFSWHYIGGYKNLREFVIANSSEVPYVAQPMARLAHSDYSYFFREYIQLVALPRVKRVEQYFLRELPHISKIMLPHVKHFSDKAFHTIPYKHKYTPSNSIVLGVPGAAVPTATAASFVDMKTPNLFLVYLNEQGEELTGAEREAAKARYKAVDDGDTSDNLWFGWQLDYLRVRVDEASQVNGKVNLLTPALGVAWQGAPVEFTVTPNAGYGVERVEYQVEGSTERTTLPPDASGKYNLSMPGANVTIFVVYGARTYNVEVESGIPRGSLSATPNVGVTVGTKVEVTCTGEEGYEVDQSEFYYQKLENGLPVGPQIPIEVDADGKYTFAMPDHHVKVFGKFKAMLWDLTHCANIEGGTLSTIPMEGTKVGTGDRVIAIMEPAAGYLPGTLTWKNLKTNANNSVVNNRFNMPAANVEVCATFTKIDQGDPNKFAIMTEAVPSSGGSVTANPYHDLVAGMTSDITVDAQCGYKYVEGTLKYIRFGADESVADNWLTPAQTATGYQLTMPAYTVKVRAEFAPQKQTIRLPYDGTGVDPESGSVVSVKSPATPEEYTTNAKIALQVDVKLGWKLKSISWREDDGTSVWHELNLADPWFTMPCQAVEVQVAYERIGFTVVDVQTTGGEVSSSPKQEVGVGSDIIVDLRLDPDYSLVVDPNDQTKRAVWWSPVDASDPNKRAALVEGETKFRIPYKHFLYRFEMPGESVVKLGKIWVWADFTNEGNRVGFMPIPFENGVSRGELTANRYVSVPVDFEVQVIYKRNLENAGWALDERKVEYIEAELVGGELKPKEGAEWRSARGRTFQMPNSHVIVRAEVYPTGNSVYQHPDQVSNGRIVATPWANVPLNTEVKLEAVPEEGYEMSGVFEWAEQGQDVWHQVEPNAGNTFRMPNYSVYVRCTFVSKKYTVTAEDNEGGTLHPRPALASVGSVVFVDYIRMPGWSLVVGSIEWAKEGSDEWFPTEEGRFKMPASNVRVRAQFERIGSEECEVQLLTEGEGVLEVYDGEFQISDKMRVASGTVLRIERKPEAGWQATDLEVNDAKWTEETYVVRTNTKIKAIFMQDELNAVETMRHAHVYPNPFDGVLHVEAEGAREVVLYTAGGLRVHRELYRNGVLSLESLPSGVYVLRIRFAEGEDVVRRVVKR